MRRSLFLITLTSAALALGGQGATAKAPRFALGAYKGATSLGGKVQLKLTRSSCDAVRSYLVKKRGYCFKFTRLTPVPKMTCADPDSQRQADQFDLQPYGTHPETIHLPDSGKYRDYRITGFGDGALPKPSSYLKFDFQARGRKVTGTVRVRSGGDGKGKYACSEGHMTFTARR